MGQWDGAGGTVLRESRREGAMAGVRESLSQNNTEYLRKEQHGELFKNN